MSTRLPGLIVLLLFVNGYGLASSAPYWGTFTRDNCIKPGFRKYYARLWEVEGEWGPACKSTPAWVQNVYFPTPDRCVDKAIAGEWGEFFLREGSCDPWWHQINNYQCATESFHKYSSWLEHIEGDWEDWCVQTPAVVRGIFFPTPTQCYKYFFHEWADFEVPDICCSHRGHTDLIKDTGSTKRLQLYYGEDGYMGLCVAPRSFVHWLELIHDAVELWREREQQTCSWPIAGAVVAARRINSNGRTALVDSKCILKVFNSWRNAGGAARSDDEDECEPDEDMPPFPIVSDQVRDMAGAVAEFGVQIIRTAPGFCPTFSEQHLTQL